MANGSPLPALLAVGLSCAGLAEVNTCATWMEYGRWTVVSMRTAHIIARHIMEMTACVRAKPHAQRNHSRSRHKASPVLEHARGS